MITWKLICGHTGSSSGREYAPSAVGTNYFCNSCCSYQEVTELYNPNGKSINALPYPSQDNYKGYNWEWS